jgi:hypothetical protein
LIIRVTIITDPNHITKFEDQISSLVQKYGESPFALPSFLKLSMYEMLKPNYIPMVILVHKDQELIGLAPLILKNYYGIHYAEFLLEFWSSIDFVTKNQYQSLALTTIFDVLFKRLNCKIATLCLPAESPNMKLTEQIAKSQGLHIKKKINSFMSHPTIFLSSHKAISYEDLLKSRHFLHQVRQVERNLNKKGNRKILLFKNCENSQDENLLYDKIMLVDKLSWKTTYRKHINEPVEDSWLRLFFKATSYRNNKCKLLQRKIWFIEVENQPIAFCLAIQFKGTAYFCKTSFVEKFRKCYPGILLHHYAIKDIAGEGEIQKVDFMTNLPFTKKWRTINFSRVETSIGGSVIFGLQTMKKVLQLLSSAITGKKRSIFYAETAFEQLRKAQNHGKIEKSNPC